MHPTIRAYLAAGFRTREEIIEHARIMGEVVLCDVLAALDEDVRQNSTAMIVVKAEPPGKNVCSMIRKAIGNNTKLIVAVQPGPLAPGNFEKLIRASMPDCEKKLRVMDVGDSIADAVSSAETNHLYSKNQALTVFCDQEEADEFNHQIKAGGLNFDPSVIMVTPMEITTDDVGAISKAVFDDDLDAMHRVLDPHIFSDQDSLQTYKSVLKGGQSGGLFTVGGESEPMPKESIKRKFPGQKLFVHFSSRPEPPQVPDRSRNTFSGGTGPLGIYTYPLHASMTFGADRKYAFILKPTVPVLNTQSYTRAQLQSDLAKLDSLGDFSRPKRLWQRFYDEYEPRVGPPFYQLWYLISRIPFSDDPEDLPSWDNNSRFANPARGREILVALGYKVIEDEAGLIYATEPMQTVFLTDDSFEIVDQMTEPTGFGGKTSSLVEFLTDIAPSRELGIRKLSMILRHELGDHFADLEYLGSGRNGSAYRTPDGLIVKITTDPKEAASAQRLRGLRCEYIHQIHTVNQIDENIWVILQEGNLESLPPEYCEEFDTAMEIVEVIGAGHALRRGDAREVKEIMMRSGHADLCTLVAEVMKKFDVGGMLREIKELGLEADFHSGNIKLREGCPVLIDLGTHGDDPGEQNGPPDGDLQVNELAGMMAAPQAGAGSQMRGSNSSAWAGGRLVLSKPETHVPEDENESERDHALDQDIVGGGLDWGISRSRSST